MRSAVSKVAQYFPTCIVSGRRRDKVYILIFMHVVFNIFCYKIIISFEGLYYLFIYLFFRYMILLD